jgi:hypothetical protein
MFKLLEMSAGEPHSYFIPRGTPNPQSRQKTRFEDQHADN